ncbi:WD40/YVTN/BNR-like repeat-containing protein [Litorihabitans aurantiacus]|uniref:Photosynthesis system II assembly factor Ycf48/Hcf136-like domain-containing protein n=1 Tax=Litorihabitans aurantiacus TaxID=1930061 RepID=A0AA37UWJ3_9MICO|nr:hypothetical protein [Litorihabitans aurantiacus]GMA30382.1 hypothetical protein GCM10025875_03740 [Litorihabitans aurantiacus]
MRAGRTWGIAVMAVLVVANAVVVAALLSQSTPGGAEALPPETVASPPLPEVPQEPVTSAPPEEMEEPDTENSQAAAIPVTTAVRQIVGVDDETAWRATLASCGQGAAIVERTLDGGASWEATELDVDSVVRLRATDASSAFVVGAVQDCATALAATTDGGDTWNRADATLSSAWFLAPTDRTFVAGPRGDAPVPCPAEAVDLAAVDAQRGAVLCQDGSIAVSDDGGQSWTTTVSVAGARALTQDGPSYAVATFEGPCEALSIYDVSSAGQAQAEPFSCAPVASAAEVAVSVTGDLMWVWSGSELAISRDGGQTW